MSDWRTRSVPNNGNTLMGTLFLFVVQKTDGMFRVTLRIGLNQKLVIEVIQCPVVSLLLALVDNGVRWYRLRAAKRLRQSLEKLGLPWERICWSWRKREYSVVAECDYQLDWTVPSPESFLVAIAASTKYALSRSLVGAAAFPYASSVGRAGGVLSGGERFLD